MVSLRELSFRLKDFFRFSRQELSGLALAVVVTGFVFSFRDWGTKHFDLVVGLSNFFLMIIIAAISLVFRTGCQKIYALGEGYLVQFKVWLVGLGIMLVLTFLSFGSVPLVLVGSVVASLMVKQRLGEFRYGFSYGNNAMIGAWGVLGNMILAIFFAIGVFYRPESYFFSKGLLLNMIMGFLALLPLPQLDGLKIFFGSRFLYFLLLFAVILNGVLLYSRTKIGLIAAVIIGVTYGIIYLLIRSEK